MSKLPQFFKRSLTRSPVLFIPCRLIWKVKIKRVQKTALAFCLCLTIVVMICTVARIAGLTYHNTFDATWETFWHYISASVGLTLTSIAAFRSLFISHHVSHRQQETSDFEALQLLFAKIKQALRRTTSTQCWRPRVWYCNDSDNSDSSDAIRGMDLGTIERGTITGLRTFIHEHRRSSATESNIMHSNIQEEFVSHKQTIPLPDNISVGEIAGNHRQQRVSSDGGSGRHEKILVHKDSRRHDKILAHKESRKQDKILNSQESRKRDKMLVRQEADTRDKVPAIDENATHDGMVNRPANVGQFARQQGERSGLATGDSDFDDGGRYLSSNANRKAKPTTKVGVMSKMTCGGLVFSAGIKAERYREEE